MFRITRSLKTKSLVTLGASIGLLASTTGAVALAEGNERKQKLPIYDEPEPEMMIKEEPTRLDEALRAARKETDRHILGMKYHLQMVTNKVVDLEKEAESSIKSVLVKEEEVMPAALYVIVAGFAGSIVASRRNILLRFLTPVAFSAMAFGYFFPASSNRLIAQANQSDFSKYIPQDLQKQIRDMTGQVNNSNKGSPQSTWAKTAEEIKQTAKEDKDTLDTKKDDAEVALKETVKDVKEKVAEIKKTVVEEVKKEQSKVEKKAEESDKEARIRKIREEDSLKRV